MHYLVYPAAAEADIREALDPLAGHEGVGPLILGLPVVSADGRYCHCHALTEAEADYAGARIEGITGASLGETLPADWQP